MHPRVDAAYLWSHLPTSFTAGDVCSYAPEMTTAIQRQSLASKDGEADKAGSRMLWMLVNVSGSYSTGAVIMHEEVDSSKDAGRPRKRQVRLDHGN